MTIDAGTPTTEAPPAPPPTAPAPAQPADVAPLTAADIPAIVAAVAKALPQVPAAAAQAAAAAVPEPPTSPTNLFEKGQLVSYSYVSPYDGEVTRHGLVLDVLPDDGVAGARSTVAWFNEVSGPIGDHLLAAG